MAPQSERPDACPEEERSSAGPTQPGPSSQQPGTSQPAASQTASEYKPVFVKGALFPHEVPSEHWDADFADSRQVYQGSALPIWLLAGWAIFIVWALVYLYFGLSTV
jgi:hypothetical protein